MHPPSSYHIHNFSDFLCEYFCWILSFNGASRLLWLSFFWFILEFITRVIARKNGTPKTSYLAAQLKDNGSWWLITLSSLLIFGIIVLVLHVRWASDLPASLIPLGIILMLMGTALRIWAVISLGKFFTMEVVIFPNHHLIDKGPYQWLQHPSYSGVFITAIGLGLATGYVMVLIAFLIILGFSLGYRIYVEEKALKERFGSEWVAYAKRTWRILPWIL
ncbi:MAG: isoprenylcysteine carboxylmethyltransferase family protein [Parachlamydiaceae bacterium]